MKKLILFLILLSSTMYAGVLGFSEPTSTHIDYSTTSGLAPINYNMYVSSDLYAYYYWARLVYPDGSKSAWQQGETGGWWVPKAGTYGIEGKASVKSIFGGSIFTIYSNYFTWPVVDNYAPAAPTNLAISGTPGSTPVHLSWSANLEGDMGTYIISRKISPGGSGGTWQDIATVSTNSYDDSDWLYASGSTFLLSYKIRARDINNNTSGYSNTATCYAYPLGKESFSTDNLAAKFDFDYQLNQNYPNPFNPTTSVSFSIPEYSYVSLKVYNSVGQEVKTLVSDYREKGNYNAVFNASELPSGIYFTKMQAGNFSSIRKMILLK